MSPSVYITSRLTKSGTRYVVRYRRGGRLFKLLHAGSFKTLKEARARRDFVAGELAAGRDPAESLRVDQEPRRTTLRQWGDVWLASRVDLDDSSRAAYRSHLRAIYTSELASRDVASLALADVQEWVSTVADRQPATVRAYMTTLRQVLDYAGVSPNPARDRRLRLPRRTRDEHEPPSSTHVLAILERVSRRMVLPLVTIEQTAMRVSEVETLVWGDVDVAGGRFRLRSRETKRDRARWVQVPEWLMATIAATCAVEDRTPERRVFLGFTSEGARKAMARACTAAQIPHFHPHDLRHRRASLWHGQGISARELAERGGWSSASLPLDVYTHVMPLEEVPTPALQGLIERHQRR